MKETALLIDCTASALDLAWADSNVMDRWDASALSADVVNTHAICVTSLALRAGENEYLFTHTLSICPWPSLNPSPYSPLS